MANVIFKLLAVISGKFHPPADTLNPPPVRVTSAVSLYILLACIVDTVSDRVVQLTFVATAVPPEIVHPAPFVQFVSVLKVPFTT